MVNGIIKVVAGIRRGVKPYLMNALFYGFPIELDVNYIYTKNSISFPIENCGIDGTAKALKQCAYKKELLAK